MTPFRKSLLTIILTLLGVVAAQAAVCDKAEFENTIRITDSLLQVKCGSYGALHVKKIVNKNGVIDFHFTSSIGDFPIRPGYDKWLKSTLKKNFPYKYRNCRVGQIYCEETPLSGLAVSRIGNDGTASYSPYRLKRPVLTPLVTKAEDKAAKGLYGRHIALWNSHGLYFDFLGGEWKWQRPHTFGKVEDLFTYEFVEELLCKMLENAGANVLLPRERDPHSMEMIIDNDSCEGSSGRIHGSVETKGKWATHSGGFQDYSAVYRDSYVSPFHAGSYLSSPTVTAKNYEHTVKWKGNVPERGVYAVYVSYKTLPESISNATYVVHELGADKKVYVNQKMGSGTWVYLGDFEFDAGERTLVSLSNLSAQKGVVTADAVKIGGGTGNIGRSGADGEKTSTSMCPRAYEAARYFLQWCGMPKKVWYHDKGENDYRDDIICHGEWVKHLSGGSVANPKAEGLNIPVDLSFAFHTDAGTKPDGAIVGTLSIYTLSAEGKKILANGSSRNTCRELSDFVQTQVVNDIRNDWDPEWRRRQLWNRSYSESRTSGVPAVLLELLSHQNFEDMRYAADPLFRFTVARSCYKAMLKYLSMRYACPYVVQPLPVRNFSASLENDRIILEWEATPDPEERTAGPSGYLLYTRVDGGGWNEGEKTSACMVVRDIRPGHIYSYKVVAVNEGGKSFPSEILSAGIPMGGNGKTVRVVNAFTRVSGPCSWSKADGSGNFEPEIDSGVPYKKGIGSAGNSFDYPYMHGKAIMEAGYSFDSCSSGAFTGVNGAVTETYAAVDLIFGKQCRVITGRRSPVRDGCLTPQMRKALTCVLENGCNIIVSGSYIASDAYHNIFGRQESEYDEAYGSKGTAVWWDEEARKFAAEKLGYSLHRAYACNNGIVRICGTDNAAKPDNAVSPELSYFNAQNQENYSVESPDALRPSGKNGVVTMRYGDTDMPAAVFSDFGKYRSACFGFPLESLCEESGFNAVMLHSLEFLDRK